MKIKNFSLLSSQIGEKIIEIIKSALLAVDPAEAVSRHLDRSGKFLYYDDEMINLDNFRHVLLVSVGKAGAPMAAKTIQILGDDLDNGIIVVKEGESSMNLLEEGLSRKLLNKIHLIEAGHPIPDQRSILGAHAILDLFKNTTKEDLVICLISGGGSSLMVAPPLGITLSDLQGTIALLLDCGASIHQINTLRKHLDLVKGGGLAKAISPATLRTLILSDVVGDNLDVIASGPTVPDSTTFDQAYKILERYEIIEKVPTAIKNFITRGVNGEIPETLKENDPVFSRVKNLIIGSNKQAAQAAQQKASELGFFTFILTNYLEGEARQVGKFFASISRQVQTNLSPVSRPALIIAGGETTVTIKGEGLGGRNQELALGAVEGLAGLSEMYLITLATDGEDGITDAAGAVVTGDTLARSQSFGLNPLDYLNRNDSYNFFKPLGDLLITGPTLTNVNDLVFLFAA